MLLDHGPSDLVVALSRGLHCVPRHVVERDRVGEDAHCLVEGTEPEEMDTEQSDILDPIPNSQVSLFLQGGPTSI